jgi:hypothetical protein
MGENAIIGEQVAIQTKSLNSKDNFPELFWFLIMVEIPDRSRIVSVFGSGDPRIPPRLTTTGATCKC